MGSGSGVRCIRLVDLGPRLKVQGAGGSADQASCKLACICCLLSMMAGHQMQSAMLISCQACQLLPAWPASDMRPGQCVMLGWLRMHRAHLWCKHPCLRCHLCPGHTEPRLQQCLPTCIPVPTTDYF